MSLKIEKSELAESDEREREGRPFFSSASSNGAECCWEDAAADDNVRNGMFAGRREELKEGIVTSDGAVLQQPLCV